jgi:penicillin-binding protein-related factor A (putative recombinase)
MAVNRGKQFEKTIEKQLKELSIVRCERLHDQMTGFVEVSKNPADFIVYKYPYMYYVECKTTHEPSIPITNLPQLERIAERCTTPGIKGKFIIWFVTKQKTYWVDYTFVQKCVQMGCKSINYNLFEHECNKEKPLVKLIPAKYLRVFGKYDLSGIWEDNNE